MDVLKQSFLPLPWVLNSNAGLVNHLQPRRTCLPLGLFFYFVLSFCFDVCVEVVHVSKANMSWCRYCLQTILPLWKAASEKYAFCLCNLIQHAIYFCYLWILSSTWAVWRMGGMHEMELVKWNNTIYAWLFYTDF